MSTLRLAHGTSARHLESILANGIRPRGKGRSQWKECPSAPDRVYLTDAYAFYFAQQAVKAKDDALIIECEVDRGGLLADEDPIAQLCGPENPLTLKYPDLRKRTKVIRDRLPFMDEAGREELLDTSLTSLGTAAYLGTIEPKMFVRAALVPAADITRVVLMECDPTITTLNYTFMGDHYRKFQDSLFERYPLKLGK
jgi:hypothetical protein